MGCIGSKVDSSEKEAAQQNARIDRQLRHDRKQQNRTVKILLLGKPSMTLRAPVNPASPLTTTLQVLVNRVNPPLSNKCESSILVDFKMMSVSK